MVQEFKPTSNILSGSVGPEMVTQLMEYLATGNGRDITLMLNSDGGAESHGLAMIDLIRLYPGDVTIVVAGEAQSMAAVLLQAGDVRIMTESSMLMLHGGTIEIPAMSKESALNYIEYYFDVDDKSDQILVDRIKEKHPEMTMEKLREELMPEDWYLSAKEALNWGLIDQVLEQRKLT